MNIGIDIDDTISNTSEQIDKLAKKYTEEFLGRKIILNNEIDILDPMWAKHLYNWTDEEDSKFWDLYYNEAMENVEPKESAIEIINKLSENNKIYIITARWDKNEGEILKLTKDWLKKHDIQYFKLFLGHLDKRNIIIENDIEIFIDDSYKTCKEVSKLNIKTMMMDSRLNKKNHDPDILRVFSWNDIKENIFDI